GQARTQELAVGRPLRAGAIQQSGGGANPRHRRRRGRRSRARPPRGRRARDGPLQPAGRAGVRGAGVIKLWEGVIAAAPRLEGWIARGSSEIQVARLPRPAWPIVAGAVARACIERGKTVLILAPAPERFADEMRLWLAGRPTTNVFAEVAVSFLDRPPAFDEAINRRLEALTVLAEIQPAVVVSSRRAITRQTISRTDLAESTVVLKPGQGPAPVVGAGRLSSGCATR